MRGDRLRTLPMRNEWPEAYEQGCKSYKDTGLNDRRGLPGRVSAG